MMKLLSKKGAIALNILVLGVVMEGVSAADKTMAGVPPGSDTVSVKKFGAKGDNIQNDSAAFQTAIIYASKNRKVLFVPKGVYRVNNLLLYPNISIVGERSNSVLTLTNGAQSNRQCLLLTGISQNIQLKNIVLDANGRNNSGKNIFCVKTSLNQKEIVNNLTFINCRFTDSKDYGALFLIGPAGHITNVKVAYCTFYNTGSSAVSIRGINGLTFNYNQVSAWSQLDKSHPAVSFQSDQCSNVVFVHNYFKNKDAGYFAVEVAGTKLINGRFMDNTFDGNGYDASGISGMFNNCLFKNNKHLNGAGSHRSGYELVGDYDTIADKTGVGGSISLGAGVPQLAFSKGGSAYIVTGNKVSSNAGVNNLCLDVGGVDTVKGAFIENNVFDNRGGKGNAPVIQIGKRGPAANVTIQNNQLYGSTTNPCIRMSVAAGNHFARKVSIRKNVLNGKSGIQIDEMPVWKEVEISDNDFTGISGSAFLKSNDFSHDFHIERNKVAAGH